MKIGKTTWPRPALLRSKWKPLRLGTVLVALATLCGAAASHAGEKKCQQQEINANFYQQFIRYRQAVNSANAPQDLAKYFSPTFNRYFEKKLEKASTDEEKSRALGQYWDNLNSAADVVSVYRQQLECHRDHPVLVLLGSLKSDLPKIGEIIPLWRIHIEYSRQPNGDWRIENIEFNKLKKTPAPLRLLNNFSVIP